MMMVCEHDLAEMDTAAHWDGLCPLCLQEEIERLKALNEERRNCNQLGAAENDRLKAELAEYTELKEYAKSLGQETYLQLHAENERLRAKMDTISDKTSGMKPTAQASGIITFTFAAWEAALNDARATERERCARVAERLENSTSNTSIAAAIRGRKD